MTATELNRDVKRLLKNIKAAEVWPANQDYIQNGARKEFLRLYWADTKFEYMNRQSILIMLRLNLKYHFEPTHMFGIFIEI